MVKKGIDPKATERDAKAKRGYAVPVCDPFMVGAVMRGSESLPSAVVAKVTGKAKRKPGEHYGYVTYQDEYSYAGVTYPINSAKSGCYKRPISAGAELALLKLAVYVTVPSQLADRKSPYLLGFDEAIND